MQLGSDVVIMSDSTDQNRQIDLEIEELRAFTRPTSRVTSTALEDRLYKIFPVLDHGFVRVIDYMGDDTSIVQAARVSYGKGTKSVRNDEGLIRYLMRHRHSTPFEMCEIKFHIKLPIFVARQWIRHRTANVNEYSARYSMLDREFYIPAPEHLAAQSDINNQGRGDVLRDEEAAENRGLDPGPDPGEDRRAAGSGGGAARLRRTTGGVRARALVRFVRSLQLGTNGESATTIAVQGGAAGGGHE